nr:MAG TPA: hypothetical protein [Caudoviricetes sp.]
MLELLLISREMKPTKGCVMNRNPGRWKSIRC